ncbi:MAG: UDP-2,3-diacylglucosamine diphosphatase LpxI [Pirellulales bacterium]|nr:UDP-2,3-diacylglucosamine diphosphatase LpxI [Pirellulales bacterium]
MASAASSPHRCTSPSTVAPALEPLRLAPGTEPSADSAVLQRDESSRPLPAPAAAPRIGLFAGWGTYPITIARSLRENGYSVYCLGVKDHADPAIAQWCDEFRWVGLAKLGAAIRFFRRHRVSRVMMAGKIFKTRLFARWMWLKHLPDWRTIRCFYPSFLQTRRDRKDDTLLLALINELARDRIEFAAPTDYLPELLVREGVLTDRAPSKRQLADIDFGWQVAKELGRVDVGQSVVVKNRAVMAVEAIEGTDACIRRAGTVCEAGEFTVVKVAKPQQDMRFDVPTVGLGTLESMVVAGGRVLAVEAGRTILLDEQAVVEFANRHKLVIVATHGPAPRE